MECDCQKKKKLRIFMRTRDFKEDEIVRLLQAAFQSFVVADMVEIELRKGVVDALYGKTYYEFVIDNARVRVYFATQKIDAVVDVIEKGVKKTDLLPTRYLRDSVIKCLAQIFYKQNQSPSRDDFVEILHKILDTKISKYTVYGQLFGVKITKRKKIGAFEFLPDKTFSAILKSGSLPENVIDLLTNACKGCVCTQVSAGDFDAARALAQEDFKWLENAVRLFATGNGSFFSIGRGIWDYKLPPVVVDCGGKVCGIGGIDGTNPFGDENLIFKNKDLKRVIERLGKSEGLTKMQGALRHGVYLGGMSMQETNRTLAFFLAVSAMESFIVYDDDKYVNAGIAELPEVKFFPNVDMPLFTTDVQTKVDKKIGEIRQQGFASWRKFIADVEQALKKQQSSCVQKLKELREGDLYKKGAKHILENGQLNELAQKIRYEEGLLADVKKLVDRKLDLERKNAATIDDFARHHHEFYTASCKFAESIRLEKNGLSIAGGVVVKRDALNRYIDGRMTRVSKDQKDWYDKILAHDSFDDEKVKEFLKQTMRGEVQYNKDVDEKTVVVELLSTCWFRVNYDIVYQNDRLSQMSPGKRSFVILQPLLEFSNKKCPILIDQPEDNLDNRAIFKDLVTYLRTKKKERQIILVTHNPNVVVGADAEQVIVANQHGNDSANADNVRFAYASGSLEASWGKTSTTGPILESQGIREHVCEILEGGEEAFKKRESKYGLWHK